MTTLITRLTDLTQNAFAACGFERKFGVVQLANRPDLADFQCNGALAVAKMQKANPREVAQTIIDALDGVGLFETDIAGPGFINFKLSDAALCAQSNGPLQDPAGLITPAAEPQRFLLDYGGPNLAKEMHVGHLRSSIIGQSLKTILRFAGHKADGDIHLGDWGLQMGQLVSYIQDIQPQMLEQGADIQITMADLQAWYPAASALSKSDDAFRERARRATQELQHGHPAYTRLWEAIRDASNAALKRDFDWLGVNFEYWYGESRYQSMLDGICKAQEDAGVAVVDDGALIVRMKDAGKLPPLILRNAKGGYGYGATDLATITERSESKDLDTLLYVVDARQAAHFKQVFNAATQIGLLDAMSAEHIAFGTVNGTDGKPFKTREGGTMRLVDLIQTMTDAAKARLDEAGSVAEDKRDTVAEQVARGAIKFGELSHDREKDYIFSAEQFLTFEGKTGPYIQYTCVRIDTLMAKAAAEGLHPAPTQIMGEGGRDLVLAMDALPQQLERAVNTRKPSHIANHVYRLADASNRYYQQNRILAKGVDKDAGQGHLNLLAAARAQMALCLDLMGIEVPEQM